jgi:nucleoside-diphosphate-sugar epimerase
MSSYLVTGGTGFIGGYLVRQLSDAGHDVCCLTRRPLTTHDMAGSARWVQADLLQPETYEHLLAGTDYVVHSAGIINSRRPEEYYETNVLVTQRLIEACIRMKAPRRRFVLMSSIAAMGANHSGGLLRESDPCRPESEYGRSKLDAETVARGFRGSVPLVIIRPSFVFGKGDVRGLAFLKTFWKQTPSLASSLIRNFSVCHVSDLVRGCLQAMDKDVPSGDVFILSDPEVHAWISSQKMLREILCEVLPPDSWPEFPPDDTLLNRFVAARLPEELQQYWGCDVTKAQRELEFSPRVQLPWGARETIQWYLNEGLLPPPTKTEATISAEGIL